MKHIKLYNTKSELNADLVNIPTPYVAVAEDTLSEIFYGEQQEEEEELPSIVDVDTTKYYKIKSNLHKGYHIVNISYADDLYSTGNWGISNKYSGIFQFELISDNKYYLKDVLSGNYIIPTDSYRVNSSTDKESYILLYNYSPGIFIFGNPNTTSGGNYSDNDNAVIGSEINLEQNNGIWGDKIYGHSCTLWVLEETEYNPT